MFQYNYYGLFFAYNIFSINALCHIVIYKLIHHFSTFLFAALLIRENKRVERQRNSIVSLTEGRANLILADAGWNRRHSEGAISQLERRRLLRFPAGSTDGSPVREQARFSLTLESNKKKARKFEMFTGKVKSKHRQVAALNLIWQKTK